MSKYSPEFFTHMKREYMSLNAVKQAIRLGAILEARVIRCNQDNSLVLDLGKDIVGIINFDEVEYHPDKSPIKPASATSKVNKHIKFIPLEITKEDDKYIVKCSRKQVQEKCYNEYISKLLPGDVIDAYALKIVSYGIFCDIGCGIVALLPTNNISITHIVNPIDELKGISTLKVVVKSIDDNYKIELSHKELLGTWEQESEKFKQDDVVCGTVLSIEEYGVFVRLSQNLSGLAEKTDIELVPGDTVLTRVQCIQSKNMKIKLSIISKEDNTQIEHTKFKYYITDSHISDWKYSTDTAKKQIESHF